MICATCRAEGHAYCDGPDRPEPVDITDYSMSVKKMSTVIPVSAEQLIDAGYDVPGYRPTNVRLSWSRWRRLKWAAIAAKDPARMHVGCWIAGIEDPDERL